MAGERFGVRNSGTSAIVEGIGDHGCEYMTGGSVIILGKTGVNFGAGMTGGFALILDQENNFISKLNTELVEAIKIDDKKHIQQLDFLNTSLDDYILETKSKWGQHIKENISKYSDKFYIVIPKVISLEELFNNKSAAA